MAETTGSIVKLQGVSKIYERGGEAVHVLVPKLINHASTEIQRADPEDSSVLSRPP